MWEISGGSVREAGRGTGTSSLEGRATLGLSRKRLSPCSQEGPSIITQLAAAVVCWEGDEEGREAQVRGAPWLCCTRL